MNKNFSRIIERIKREFYRTPTIILISIPVTIGFTFFIIHGVLNPQGYSRNGTGNFLLSLAFFSCGLSGIPMIIKRETPIITGIMAIIQGLLLLAVGTALALLTIIGPLLKK